MENLKNLRSKKFLSEEDLKELKELSELSFCKIGSESYRQKLVYNLLNIIRANDQPKFLWTISRVLNSQKENNNVKDLAAKLNSIYPLTKNEFEKVAYSIIMGIISSESEFGGE